MAIVLLRCSVKSCNKLAAGSVHHGFFLLSATFQTYCPNLTSLTGCRTWCPTDLQHLCCKALINKINKIRTNYIFLVLYKNSICDQVWQKGSYRPWQVMQIFHTNTKLHECTIRFQCQTWPVKAGLLLLAAYSWPSDDPYQQSGVFMALWEASGELCVLVKSRGAR